MYHPLLLQAQELRKTPEYRRERKRRQGIAEGTFASLDRLGWSRSRLRGLWKADCEGYMAALAHNVPEAGAQTEPRRRTTGPGAAISRRNQGVRHPSRPCRIGIPHTPTVSS